MMNNDWGNVDGYSAHSSVASRTAVVARQNPESSIASVLVVFT